MPNDFPQSLDPTGAVRARLANPATSSQAPGTLSKWEDAEQNQYWEFVGNNQTSSTDFVSAVAEREAAAGGPPELAAVAAQRTLAQAAAHHLLGAERPDDPIPTGEVRELSLKGLVAMMGPFLQRYQAEQQQLQQQQRTTAAPAATDGSPASVDEHKRAIGQVFSQGLSIPTD